jgi:hypothetical protein
MTILSDLFSGYQKLNVLDKVAKLQAARVAAHDPDFKRLWLEKAVALQRKI